MFINKYTMFLKKIYNTYKQIYIIFKQIYNIYKQIYKQISYWGCLEILLIPHIISKGPIYGLIMSKQITFRPLGTVLQA